MNSFATARALGALALLAFAACSDGGTPTLVPPPPPIEGERPNHVPPASLFGDSVYTAAIITCNATRSPATISCGSPQFPAGTVDDLVGGKGVHVRMLNNSPSYSGGIFQVPIRLRNLLVNRIGTADGTTQGGLLAFVMENPQTTGGSGVVTVNNADSTGTFTQANQPYFFYDTILPMRVQTANRTWRFNVPATVSSFRFKVYVAAPILPVVVFDKDSAGNRDIYRVNLDGTDLTRLTTSVGPDLDPTVGNSKLVFVSYRDGQADLFSMSLVGGAQTRLTVTALVNETSPALSMDGQRLAFISDAAGVDKLWIGNNDATNAAPVSSAFSELNAVEFGPAWDRSSRLLFVNTRGATADLYYYTLAGSAFSSPGAAVNSTTAADVEPAYSHDGVRFAWTTNRDSDVEVYWRSTATGTLRLTTRAGVDAQPTFFSDGKVAWVEDGGTPVIRWRVLPAGATGSVATGTGVVRNPYGVPLHQ